MRRKTISMVLATLMVVGLTACGSSDSATDASTTTSDEASTEADEVETS
jgi:ABC-type glycerol-3-phosphate transport system substrate-binding protein